MPLTLFLACSLGVTWRKLTTALPLKSATQPWPVATDAKSNLAAKDTIERLCSADSRLGVTQALDEERSSMHLPVADDFFGQHGSTCKRAVQLGPASETWKHVPLRAPDT